MELENFDEALEALIASGAGELRRRRVDRRAAPAPVAPRVLRHRGHGGLRGRRGVGGRRGQDGGELDRDAVSGAPSRPPSAGCASGGRCATCPRWPRPGGTGPSGGSGPGHRLGPAAPHRGRHGPGRGDAGRPGQRAGLRGLLPGRSTYWKQLADPDGAEASDEERKASRNVFLESSLDGMWLGQMTLDPISGSIVASELNRLEHDLFEADCAEAKERLGRTARIDELARTSGQRRADALVEMATRSRTAPAEGIRPAPLFSVFVGYETIHGRICELENGTVLHPSCPRALDGLGLLRAGHLLFGQPHRRQRAGPASSPEGPAGPSSCVTASAPTPTATSPPRAARSTTSRPTPRRAHHPGQRPAALWLPQPPAQPARATGERPPPVASSASGHHRAPPEGAARRRPAQPAPARSTPAASPAGISKSEAPRRFGAPDWRARVSARPR